MKKIFGIVFVFAFVALLTGCGSGSKVSCTFVSNSGESPKEIMTAEFDSDGKVTKLTGEVVFKDADTAKENFEYVSAGFKDDAKVSGTTIILNNLESKAQYSNIVGMTKDEYISYMKSLEDSGSTVTCD